MKKFKCEFKYQTLICLTEDEYENIKEQIDAGIVETEIKKILDGELLVEDGREESRKITDFCYEVKEYES